MNVTVIFKCRLDVFMLLKGIFYLLRHGGASMQVPLGDAFIADHNLEDAFLQAQCRLAVEHSLPSRTANGERLH